MTGHAWESNNTTEAAAERKANWEGLATTGLQEKLGAVFEEVARLGHCKGGGASGIHPMPAGFTPQEMIDKIVKSRLMTEEEARQSIIVVPNAGSAESLELRIPGGIAAKPSTPANYYAFDIRGISRETAELVTSPERVEAFRAWRDEHTHSLRVKSLGENVGWSDGPGYRIPR